MHKGVQLMECNSLLHTNRNTSFRNNFFPFKTGVVDRTHGQKNKEGINKTVITIVISSCSSKLPFCKNSNATIDSHKSLSYF